MSNKPENLIENILEHARWAPSGDNMQTWRFEIVGAKRFIVHGHDTREHCVYDLQGHASQLAIGALLECIAIAASHYHHQADFTVRENTPETQIVIAVELTENPAITPDPLFTFLPIRSVQRRPLKTKPLGAEEKTALERAIGDLHTVKWLEGFKNRFQAAVLMYKNGKLRLTLPEAFPTHSTIIEWNARFSDDKIPDQAIGLDPLAIRLMEWALKSWKRVVFLNTYFAGTLLPRIQLDLLPGIFCAAHFALVANVKPQTIHDHLQAGRALQRFWLTASQLGLQLQPEMTPLIFTGYVREDFPFTTQENLTAYAKKLADRLVNLLGEKEVEQAVFIGRIGHGKPAHARSLRLSVAQLLSAAS